MSHQQSADWVRLAQSPSRTERIEAFFRVYKDLPKGRNPVQLSGFGDAAEAKALIGASLQRFKDANR